MRNAAVIFLAQMLLVCLVAQVNHALAGAHVYLFVGGLLIAYSALALPWHAGLAASFLVGCACDAAAPIRFGTQALLFATALWRSCARTRWWACLKGRPRPGT